MAKTSKTDSAAPDAAEEQAPKPHPNLPIVAAAPQEEKSSSCAPTDDQFTHGVYVERETGEQYALAIHDPDDYFRTHSLKNTAHFLQTTEAEFRLRFDKAS